MEAKQNIQVSDVTFEVSYTENEVQGFASVSKGREVFPKLEETLLSVLMEAIKEEPMARQAICRTLKTIRLSYGCSSEQRL